MESAKFKDNFFSIWNRTNFKISTRIYWISSKNQFISHKFNRLKHITFPKARIVNFSYRWRNDAVIDSRKEEERRSQSFNFRVVREDYIIKIITVTKRMIFNSANRWWNNKIIEDTTAFKSKRTNFFEIWIFFKLNSMKFFTVIDWIWWNSNNWRGYFIIIYYILINFFIL